MLLPSPTTLFLASCLTGNALAQTSTYFTPGVPTDKPVPGNYTGDYRPRVHFSPPTQFMNDPNGMFVDADGLYHLYYQYNPTATVAGDQHWGHATSKDLYTWTNQKIALWPPNNSTFVFSGSAVVDANNTSGFFPAQNNGVIAIYTLAEYPDGAAGPQTQNIAVSYDGGYTFDAYASNPVTDSTSTQFRDPKVLWYEPGQHWVMVLSFASDFSIGIYTSPDLKAWTPTSNVTNVGLLGLQYECPNLIEIPWKDGPRETAWLLAISINPGAPLGGSITQYLAGDFNGTHFEPFDRAARLTDFGKDNYAGQWFSGIPGTERQISMAWASNWQYTQQVPTGPTENWRSQMSLPRQNYLANATRIGYTLVSEPVPLAPIYAQELAHNSSLGNTSLLIDYSTLPSGALYFSANITSLDPDTATGNLNFTFSSSLSGEFVRGGTTVNGDTWLDRSHTYAFDNPYFTDKFSASGLYSGAAANGSWTISGVIDRSIIEIFVNGGEQSATMTFYATRPLDTLRIGASGVAANATVGVAVWGLEDTWEGQQDANGTVRGNVSASATGNGVGVGMDRLF